MVPLRSDETVGFGGISFASFSEFKGLTGKVFQETKANLRTDAIVLFPEEHAANNMRLSRRAHTALFREW